ncbi:hypothetical protein ACKKBG_A21195 [Auxenochlorella protothecoides x Auxenochlorella symbiontica]
MDTDGDRAPSLGEEQTLVRRGSFVLGTAQPSGTLRIVPASVSGNLTQVDSYNSLDTCFDTATLWPETLPLAAPQPSDCRANITISPLSTLAVYANSSRAALRDDLGLVPAPMDAHNAYSAALLGNSDARAELAKEVEVKMLILTSLQLLVPGASDAEYKQSAIPLFEMLGNMILDRPRRRRSLLTGGSLDLTDADSIASFLSQAQGMLSSTAATSSMRASVAKAVAVLIKYTDYLLSVTDVQKASSLAQSLLLPATAALQEGSLTPAQFARATNATAIALALSGATLDRTLWGNPTPGEDATGEPGIMEGGQGGGNHAKLVGGLLGGILGGAVVLLAAVAAHLALQLWHAQRRQQQGPPAAPASAAPVASFTLAAGQPALLTSAKLAQGPEATSKTSLGALMPRPPGPDASPSAAAGGVGAEESA